MATTIAFSGTLTFSSSCLSKSKSKSKSKSRVKSPSCFFIKPLNVSAPNIPSSSLSSGCSLCLLFLIEYQIEILTSFFFVDRRISLHEGVVLSSKTRNSHRVISSCMGTDMSDSSTEENIDLELPRRSLSVQFTCDKCGERTKRLVNRLAFERGTIFVQCAGCLQHHKLVDNLGLIVEYDFQKDENMDLGSDQD